MRYIRPFLKTQLCVLFILGVCCAGQAQSGRRAPKPLSPPTATPTPKESEQPSPPQKKPTLNPQTLIAGINASLSIPFYMTEAVWNGFIDRFGKVSSVVVSGDRRMNRKDASERAKKQRESYVVYLELVAPGFDSGTGQVNLDDMVVSYYIFAPGTGKVKEAGQVHVRATRSILSRRLPTSRTGEAQLNEAGRETADRIMSLLHIGDTAMRPDFFRQQQFIIKP
jgi:hypothetical protein